jgi:hypothetical protein
MYLANMDQEIKQILYKPDFIIVEHEVLPPRFKH